MEALPQVCLARVAAALRAEDLAALESASRAMRRGCAGPDCWGPQLQRDFALQVPLGLDPRALYQALRGVEGPARDVRFKALGTDGGVDREDLERYWVDHMFNSRNYDSYCSVRGADVHCFAALADQRAEGARDAGLDARREFLLRRLRLAASVFVPGGAPEIRQWASADVEAFARELLQHAGADYGQAPDPPAGDAEVLPEDVMLPQPMDLEPGETDEPLDAGAGAGAGELPAAAEFEALTAHAQGGLPVGMLLVADLPPVSKEKELQLVGQVLRGRSHSPPETEVLEGEAAAAARPEARSGEAGPSGRAFPSPGEAAPEALRPMLWSRGDLSPGWGLPAEGLEVAVISEVEVSRRGNFTCPVSCGAVFLGMGLEEPPPLHRRGAGDGGGGAAAAPRGTGISKCVREACRVGGAGPVSPFDGLETPEEVVAASSSGRLPPILRHQGLPAGVVIEFDPTSPSAGGPGEAMRSQYCADSEVRRLRERVGGSVYAELQPVLWFSFDRARPGSAGGAGGPGTGLPENLPDVLKVGLGSQRVGNLACVKLIACENRMAEMGDLNEEPNIDINYVKFRGVTTRLPPGLRAY